MWGIFEEVPAPLRFVYSRANSHLMKQAFRRFSLKTYRLLRHPKHRRKSRLRGWLGRRVFDKDLWRPRRKPLAIGLAVGLLVSMLPPIPIQMLIAAILAMLLRVNIPAAAAGVWFSNPVTWVPLLKIQTDIGRIFLPVLESPSHLKYVMEIIAAYSMGAILLGAVVAGIGYLAVLWIWDVSAWLIVRRKRAHDLAFLAGAEAAVEAAKKQENESRGNREVKSGSLN